MKNSANIKTPISKINPTTSADKKNDPKQNQTNPNNKTLTKGKNGIQQPTEEEIKPPPPKESNFQIYLF